MLALARPRESDSTVSSHMNGQGFQSPQYAVKSSQDDMEPSEVTDMAYAEETEENMSRELPPLQLQNGASEGRDRLEPILEDDPASYDLVPPAPAEGSSFSLEKQSQLLFSREHLQGIFAEPSTLLRFTAFLSTHRPSSVPILIYYLDALKAIRAINYANAIAEALDPIENHTFTETSPSPTINSTLEQKASNAFDCMVREDLPAFITHQYIQVVSASISKRITGTLAPHLKEASDGLAEVFCLTDPSRPDNPIVFASEEFHRTTQYGMSYVIGRNCRFLQGPWTNPLSVKRLQKAITSERQHQEVFLNYRRDGSPFMNLLMVAPLSDSRGKVRYFIGAQVDVSGLVKDCTDMDAMARILEQRQEAEAAEEDGEIQQDPADKKDEFQALSEMMNLAEINTVRRHGGRMHREVQDDNESISSVSQRPRLLLKEPSNENPPDLRKVAESANGKLSGVYQHYFLVRPYPSLRILFASPSQRIPGILQSHFLDRIGGSSRVREELVAALAEGRGVTAKVRWTTKADDEGRGRWIHCTPLLGSNGSIGVWMIVIVNDERMGPSSRYRAAPPVERMVGAHGNGQGSANGRNRERGGSGRTDRTDADSINGDGPGGDPYALGSLSPAGRRAGMHGPPRSKYAVNGNVQGYAPPLPGSAAQSVSSLKI